MSTQTQLPETLTIDQISKIGDLIPVGTEFSAVARAIDVKETKAKDDGTGGGKPYLSVTFQVLEGEHEGLDATKVYFPQISVGSNGQYYAKGLYELIADMDAIGKPLDPKYPYKREPSVDDVRKLGQEIAKRLKKNVTPRIAFKAVGKRAQEKNAEGTWADAFNEDGTPKMRTVYMIVGTGAKPSGAAKPAPAQAPAPAPVEAPAPAPVADDLSLL